MITDPEVVSMLIGTVGFPIAAFVMLFWMMNTSLKSNTDATNNLTVMVEKVNSKIDGGK